MKTAQINDKDPLKDNRNDVHLALSELPAALHAKCPRCRRGKMFQGQMYGFRLQKMNENCPHCNLRFEREPGYFYVAMFVSYAMNVAEMISLAIGTYIFTGNLENPFLYFATIFPAVFLLSPFNYRVSRVILLYWLTPGLQYSPEMSKDKPLRLSK